jgi:putative flippase GtrA
MPNEATALDVPTHDIAAAPEVPRHDVAAAPEASRPDVAAAPDELQPHMRLVHGLRRPANWLQLVRFGLVGGAGFVINVAVYALFVHEAGFEYRIASVAAWLVAVINNFLLNRQWTFDAREGRAHFQAMRFLAVSLLAEIFSLLLLTLFVEAAGLAKVPAQALAVAASMPFNFLGNKLWTFRSEPATPPARTS